MAQLEGITITGTLVPSDTRDTYPLMDIKYVKGANYTVATYDDMIAIPADRRSDNMEITVAETNKVYRYKQATDDWVIIGTAGSAGGGGGTGGDSTNVNIDTSDLVHRSELDEFNVAEYEVKLVKIVEDGKTTINKAVADNRDQLLTVDKFDTFDINAYKTEIETIINNSKQDLITMDRLAEFDPEAYKAEVDAYINNAKKDILTLDKFDTFDPNEYKIELQKMIDTAKKDLLTIDKFDVFDPNEYKVELQKMIDNTKQELAVMDRLIEVDIEQLKAEIKAAVLAELGRA